MYYHHKSCVELSLGLHHPLHPKHPFILYDRDYSNCKVCNEYHTEYSYGCSCCNLNLHIICVSLPLTMESEVHHHPLIHIWKLDKFTWDLCGKEGSNVVCYLCAPCNFWTHKICASYLRRVKAIRHMHPLYLIHSFEVHQNWFLIFQI